MTTPPHDGSCAEFDSLDRASSRRTALRTALGVGAGLAAVSTFGGAFVETAYAATGKADRMLVVLSMRGAADGMSLMVPHGDPVYYAARPTISIPATSLLVPDSFFGLHPAFAPMLPWWKRGQVAAIHATGQIVSTRSHFAAMEEVEDADPGSTARVGGLNRLISLRAGGTSPQTGIQFGDTVLATQLTGPVPALSAPTLDGLRIAGPTDAAAAWRGALDTLWAGAPATVGKGGQEALAVAGTFTPIADKPDSAVVYPQGDLADALKATAKVLKADVGAEVVTVDQGSWDHHSWVGDLKAGNLKQMAEPLFASLAAFLADLGTLADRVTVVTISEFGRRVKENANRGLDHGHGNVMFAIGAGVKGGYYGRWPGLQNSVDADLGVTTDYRDVLAEVVRDLYPERSLATVFPNFRHTALGFMGAAVGTPTPPPFPTRFVSAWGRKRGEARIGHRVTAPAPTLTAAGRAAGVTVTYAWRTTRDGHVTRHGTGHRKLVRRAWRGATLSVHVTYHAPGYAPLTKAYGWGKVRR